MRHTIVIEIPDVPSQDAVADPVGYMQTVVTNAIERAVGRIDGRDYQAHVAQYHREDLTPPCSECGAPADRCPGGPWHDYERSQ